MLPLMKVLTVFGTRPEAIKLAPVVKELAGRPGEFQSLVCVTGQHRQMLDQVLEIFAITPDFDLNIMQPGQNLFGVTRRVLAGLEEVLQKVMPDVLVVQGDTTTAFVGALAAFYRQIPVGHVEAGLRTGDRYSPYPEEMNRCLASALTDYHFAPTKWARDNLIREDYPAESIWVTGNTVIDALLNVTESQRERREKERWDRYFNRTWGIDLCEDQRRIILVTGHRRESFGREFENICQALGHIARQHPDVRIVYPVHLNPNVQEPVFGILGQTLGSKDNNVFLLDPLSYEPFVYLMNRAYLVLTDSGGIQEEAPSLAKPVLVMRKNTERPEGVRAGTSRLVGTSVEAITLGVEELLSDQDKYQSMACISNPYGDGHAAERIADVLAGKIDK